MKINGIIDVIPIKKRDAQPPWAKAIAGIKSAASKRIIFLFISNIFAVLMLVFLWKLELVIFFCKGIIFFGNLYELWFY